jgi:hypothetical protein
MISSFISFRPCGSRFCVGRRLQEIVSVNIEVEPQNVRREVERWNSYTFTRNFGRGVQAMESSHILIHSLY